MTYTEMQAAEAAYQAATTPGAQSARKPRGASKATLAKRQARLRCCYCDHSGPAEAIEVANGH